MDFTQTSSLVLLALALVLAIWRRINIGVLGLAATFVIVLMSGLDPDTAYKHFPGDIFVLIVGISLLFGHLERSGGLHWVVDRVYGAIGGRTGLLPWAGYLIAAALSSLGAFSTAPITLLVPVIAHVSRRSPKQFLMNEIAVVIGANCAGLSPLNPTGAVIGTVAAKNGVEYQPWLIWAVSIIISAVVVALLQGFFAWLNKRPGIGSRDHIRPMGARDEEKTPILRPAYALACGAALLVFVLMVVVVRTDVGLTAMALVVILQFVFRGEEPRLIKAVPWGSVLLLCGLLTYLGTMQEIGTMDAIQRGLSATNSVVLLVFVLAYMTAVLCNIESSTLGVLGLVMPLAFSTFGGSPALSWVLVAMAVPATLTVVNPIHVAGTLIIGYTDERDQQVLFRRLLGLSVAFTAVIPGIISIVPAVMV